MKPIKYLRIEKQGREHVLERFMPAMKPARSSPNPDVRCAPPGMQDSPAQVGPTKELSE